MGVLRRLAFASSSCVLIWKEPRVVTEVEQTGARRKPFATEWCLVNGDLELTDADTLCKYRV